MGVEYFLCFVFDKTPEEVERFVSSNFKVRLREPDYFDRERMKLEWREFQKAGLLKYPVILIKKGGLWPNEPLKTAADVNRRSVDYFDLKLFKVGSYSLLELNPHSRYSWTFVKSSELLEFLKPFLKWGVLMIAGYNDTTDLTMVGLKEDDLHLLLMEFVSIVEERKRILPSGVTIVRNDFLTLENGLYELIDVDDERE
ncbi:hypothetical protein [Thermococcus sp. Bubb.Bath]|uniref:hypothetical protein n=1 Tax=Thermococcus sp. Bubb.Bath TaxID=1638242 RepID=UPI00143A12F0|nr:hypothetical protein [Thermococcus sp. Bubb.Bath]NJF25814.1 hypothetical protein [Thermococcus sp. Bubb.Bath]